jgi:hypothetical protein
MSMSPLARSRLRQVGAVLVLVLLVGVVGRVALARALPAHGWPDEWIYLTLARNIAERSTLNTNFYIASSIEALGYPHRDVHLPGYALALAGLGFALTRKKGAAAGGVGAAGSRSSGGSGVSPFAGTSGSLGSTSSSARLTNRGRSARRGARRAA